MVSCNRFSVTTCSQMDHKTSYGFPLGTTCGGSRLLQQGGIKITQCFMVGPLRCAVACARVPSPSLWCTHSSDWCLQWQMVGPPPDPPMVSAALPPTALQYQRCWCQCRGSQAGLAVQQCHRDESNWTSAQASCSR